MSHALAAPRIPEPSKPSGKKTLQNQELLAPVQQGLQAEMTLENELAPVFGKPPGQSPQPWPEIEARFKGRGPWKKSLPRILETLEALGRARRGETGGADIWRA